MTRWVWGTIALWLAMGLARPGWTKVELTQAGQPRAAIVIGSRTTWLERHAAEELAKYVAQISGAQLAIVSEGSSEARTRDRVIIGRPATCGLIDDAVRTLGLEVSAQRLGPDGFVLHTAESADYNDLYLTGPASVSPLHAVYYLLEEVFGCGFFWDGEQIPRTPSLAVPALDIQQKPGFEVRQYLQNCAFGYSTLPWTTDEWRVHLDWAAKKRFNTIMVPWGSKNGPDVAAYARRLGMKCILPGWMGHVSDEFVAAHPDAHYVSKNNLHPDDPLFIEEGARQYRETIEKHGTDHIYNIDPYPEAQPEVTTDLADAVMGAIRAADPQGVWYMSGWAWRYRNYWPTDVLEGFCRRLPDDGFYVADIFAERDAIYKRLNYFWGKRWGFGVLHSSGGADYMYGDLGDLIYRAKEVAADPRADKCIAYYLNPELLLYNTAYFQLAAELSWDPASCPDLDGYLRRYCERRYGPQGVTLMLPAWRILADTVYQGLGGRDPLYQRRLGKMYVNIADMLERQVFIDRLREALEIELAAADALGDNELYVRDVVALLRQYISETANLYLTACYFGFEHGRGEVLDARANDLDRLMALTQRLLYTYRPYWVLPVVEKARKTVGPESEADVKNTLYTFALSGPLDYQGKDMYETVAGYYRPRLQVYLDALKENIGGELPDLADKYAPIEKGWTASPIEPPAKPEFEGTTLECVKDTIPAVQALAQVPIGEMLGGSGSAAAPSAHIAIAGEMNELYNPLLSALALEGASFAYSDGFAQNTDTRNLGFGIRNSEGIDIVLVLGDTRRVAADAARIREFLLGGGKVVYLGLDASKFDSSALPYPLVLSKFGAGYGKLNVPEEASFHPLVRDLPVETHALPAPFGSDLIVECKPWRTLLVCTWFDSPVSSIARFGIAGVAAQLGAGEAAVIQLDPLAAFQDRQMVEILARNLVRYASYEPPTTEAPPPLVLLDGFDGPEIDGRRWKPLKLDPNLSDEELSPSSIVNGVLVCRGSLGTDPVLAGDEWAVEVRMLFHNPLPDWCSISIVDLHTMESVAMYAQGGCGPYATVTTRDKDGMPTSHMGGGLGGVEEWHTYRIEKTPKEVRFYLDGEVKWTQAAKFRSSNWCIVLAQRSWAAYRGANSVNVGRIKIAP